MATKAKTAEVEVIAKDIKLSLNRRQDEVASVTNLAALEAQFRTEAIDWADIEPSFPVIDKATLEGVPFVIAGFRMNESTKFMTRDEVNPEILNPGRFVSMLVAAMDENTGEFITPWSIVNDGSTGIMRSLVKYVKMVSGDATIDSTKEEFNRAAAQVPPIVAKMGLHASRYPYEEDGKITEAVTWYIG